MNILSVSFWFYFAYFWLTVFIAFYIPGIFFIKRFNLTTFQNFVLGTIVGMVFWGVQGFIFGYLNLRLLSYIYLLFFLLAWFRTKPKLPKIHIARKKFDLLLIIIITVGVFIQLTSVWFTGVMTKNGLYFCCGSQMDNILQISITDQIVKNFPPLEPGMYPVVMQNYHYWDSLVMGELIRVFKLPLIATDYQYMTILLSLFLGLSAIVFSQVLRLKKTFMRWLIFFLYFGGDFIWILIAIFRGKDFFGMTPMESGQQFLENIPRATAVLVFFSFASIFTLWIKRKDRWSGFLMAVTAATLLGFKIYLGIFVFCGLFVLALYYFIKKKYSLLSPIVFAIILGLVIYLPVNSGAGGLFFTGTWRFENFIVQPFFGTLNRLELARVIYSQHHNILRVIEYESIYALLFIFAIFGTKLLGFFQNKKSLSLLPKELNILLISGITVSAVAGLFFNQTTGNSNTFNFLVNVFIIGSIYTALACYYWFEKKRGILVNFLILIIIVLTIARPLNQTYKNLNYLINGTGFLVSDNELSVINFLTKQKDDSKFVIVDPKITMSLKAPYLSFLTGKKIFLSGQSEELETHGVNFSSRQKIQDTIFYGLNPAAVSAYLLKNNIGYIYMRSEDMLTSTDSAMFFNEIISNKEVKILEVDPAKAKLYLEQH